MGVFGPGPCRNERLVGVLVVFVERIALGIDEIDGVLELWMRALSVSGDDREVILSGRLILTPGLLCSLHGDKGLDRALGFGTLCSDEWMFLEESADQERGILVVDGKLWREFR